MEIKIYLICEMSGSPIERIGMRGVEENDLYQYRCFIYF